VSSLSQQRGWEWSADSYRDRRDTSTFVARAAKELEIAQAADEDATDLRIEARLDGVEQRLNDVEKLLRG
jgi:hypothetical protein